MSIRAAIAVLPTGLALALSACGDDGKSAPADAAHADARAIDAAPADAALDADPSIAPLVGTWVMSTDSWSGQQLTMATFRADGTFTLGGNGASNNDSGTFTVPSPNHLRFAGTQTIETQFVTDGTHLLLSALPAMGTVTGLVGTWSGQSISGGATATVTVAVNANTSASYTLTGPSGTMTLDGTWVAEGTGLALTTTGTTSITFHFRPIGSLAIGTQLFMKQ